MPTKEVLVESILPADIQAKTRIRFFVLKWTEQLVTALQEDYDRQYPSSGRYVFEVDTSGRKYYKIVTRSQGVHAFVDKNTGEVYKPASYKSPAKHVRYDLRVISDREKCLANADWAGSYLYIRG